MAGAAPTREGLALARELTALLGGSAVSCSPADLARASLDGWTRLRFDALFGQTTHAPEVVCWPGDAEQVSQLLRFASARRVPVAPIGGGAGANGAALPVRGGIALDLKRLSGPPKIDAPARTADVQAGVNLMRLEALLAEQELTLGELPPAASRASVGGFLATRGGGASSGRWGKAEDLCLALEAIDGTGHRLHTHDGPSRGLDLNQLLLGSEGTLAVFTAARLRVAPRARAQALAGLRFPSMPMGMRALQAVLRSGLRPSIARILDPLAAWLRGIGPHLGERALPKPLRALLTSGQHELLRSALRAPGLLNGVAEALGGQALLLLRFDGFGARAEDDAAEELAIARRLCEPLGAGAALSDAQSEALLHRRGDDDSLGGPGDAIPREALLASGAFVEELDVAATWDKLPAVLGAVRRAAAPRALLIARVGCAWLEGASIEATLLGPAGSIGLAANRWYRNHDQKPLNNPNAKQSSKGVAKSAIKGGAQGAVRGTQLEAPLDDELEEALAQARLRGEQALSATLSAALEAGATLSCSSGVGLARQLLLPKEHGEGMRQLRALKRAFDPQGILSPGKLLL